MSDTPAYLVVTSIPKPDKMEQMQLYASQIVPFLIKCGAEPVGRYGVVEQLKGEGGPKSIAIMKFPNAQAIKDALANDGYKALEDLRNEAFSEVNVMLCATL